MSVIHRTTLTPGKLELLASWLPGQPWYLGKGQLSELAKAGGFRLDDPRGEVGIEFMVVTDRSADQPLTYHVPLAYRGAPLDGAEHALIGISEHGVLGQRWIYDGTHDPVLVAQLFALLTGEAEPQAQSVNDTPDPSVHRHFTETGRLARIKPMAVTNGPHGTELLVEAAESGPRTGPSRQLTLQVNRILNADQDDASSAQTDQEQEQEQVLGHVTTGWLQPDGAKARGAFVVVRDTTPDPTAE